MTNTIDNTTPEDADVADHNPADKRVIAREEAAFARAAEADKRIKGDMHFVDWLAIGEGLAALRDRALRESYSNSQYGKAYTQRYAALKGAHPWAGHYDPATISHACWLHDNATDVLRWRETLATNQREAWISARVVHQHYDRMHKVAAKKAASSPRLTVQDALIQVQAENALLRKRGGGGLMPGVPADAVADAIFDAHNAAFVRRLITELNKRLATEERQDALEAQAAAKAAKRKKPPHQEISA